MMSTTCSIDDPRHGADAGADTYYAYNTLNQLTVKGDDAETPAPDLRAIMTTPRGRELGGNLTTDEL